MKPSVLSPHVIEYINRIFICLFILVYPLSTHAKTNEKGMVEAMNSGNWFSVDSIYTSVPHESLSEQIELLAQCVIGNRFNRPEISINSFPIYLEKYSKDMSPEEVSAYIRLYSMDLSRKGDNKKAAEVILDFLDNEKALLMPSLISALESEACRYKCLAEYTLYSMSVNENEGRIPFTIAHFGEETKNGVKLNLQNCLLNGEEYDMIFDTGSSVNIMSDSIARKLNITPLQLEYEITGVASQNSVLTIIPEVKLGNVSFTDVPFYIMHLTTNDKESDQYLKGIDIVLGNEIALQLKDFTLDFSENQLIFPVKPPVKSNVSPNMYLSLSSLLVAQAKLNNTPVLMNVDSRDARYGFLGKEFFKKNKKYITSSSKKTDINRSGIGGVVKIEGYNVANMPLTLGGNQVTVPNMEVFFKEQPFQHENNLGLKSLMLFKKVRFNLVDMVVTTEKY